MKWPSGISACSSNNSHNLTVKWSPGAQLWEWMEEEAQHHSTMISASPSRCHNTSPMLWRTSRDTLTSLQAFLGVICGCSAFLVTFQICKHTHAHMYTYTQAHMNACMFKVCPLWLVSKCTCSISIYNNRKIYINLNWHQCIPCSQDEPEQLNPVMVVRHIKFWDITAPSGTKMRQVPQSLGSGIKL